MAKRAIFLNGPPRSGKDEVGRILVRDHDAMTFKAADPLKQGLSRLLGINERHIEQYKDLPIREFPGIPSTVTADITFRELLIALSESYAKPLLGMDIFGPLLANRITYIAPELAVITDAGFIDEVVVTAKALKDAGYELSFWELHRDGCTFRGDSRSYLDHEELHRRADIKCVVELNNNGSIPDLRAAVSVALASV